MFTQFFGNYLLNNQLVTSEEMIQAITAKNGTRLKLGVLAMNAGYMTADQVEEVNERQMFEDKRFGDIAIEHGMMSEMQVEELLGTQKVGFLLLGQALVDLEILTNAELEKAIKDYKTEFRLTDGELIDGTDESAAELVEALCDFSYEDSQMYTRYLVLLMKNLIRFVGDDFTPLKPRRALASEVYKTIKQCINGEFDTETAIIFEDETTMQEFATRFCHDEFGLEEMEYIESAVSDFMNIHNGLFTVNISNEISMELGLTPPEIIEGKPDFDREIMVFPVEYTFGTFYFIISE